MNYVYFTENNQYVKVNIKTGVIKLRRDYPYIYIPKATKKQMVYLKRMWKYASDIENALWFGNRNEKYILSGLDNCKNLQ